MRNLPPSSSSNSLKESKPHEIIKGKIRENSTIPKIISQQPIVTEILNWTELTPDVFVLQAYLDLRIPNNHFIRFLTIMRKSRENQISLFCSFDDDNGTPIAAVNYEFNENHGMEFGGYIHSCRILSDKSKSIIILNEKNSKKSIKLSLKKLENPHLNEWKYDFSVCVSPLHGLINEKSIISFIEINRILGANHFYFYDYQLNNKAVRRVLERYASEGIVTLKKWTIPSENIWYHGQMSSIHHCLYENIGQTRYLIFNDLDEVLVPMIHDNWSQLMRAMDTGDHCGYRVPSIFMNPSSDPLVYLSSVDRFVSINIFRTKCIVRPELIFEQGIHHISKQNIEEFTPKTADPKFVLLFHYRTCDPMFGFQCSGIETETRLKLLAKKLPDILNNKFNS